jgi:hypothetical protein
MTAHRISGKTAWAIARQTWESVGTFPMLSLGPKWKRRLIVTRAQLNRAVNKSTAGLLRRPHIKIAGRVVP